jgi:uncharacterized protein
MRKIMLILDGIVAKHYLDTTLSVYSGNNDYIIIHTDESILPETQPDNFFFYCFDPTSLSKLSTILKGDIAEVHILLENKNDTLATLENIRTIRCTLKVTICDTWNLDIQDKHCILMNANKIISSRMTHALPNIPITAQNIGLGEGEIMEVSIPFSSSFVYRTLGSIEQRNWKIAALYRNKKILIANEHLIIQPNDTLLILGEPSVLKNVHQAIKRELGQFPMPFGNNLYLYLDMSKMTRGQIETILHESEHLNAQLKSKRLIIRIVNPNDFTLLEEIKRMEYSLLSVHVDYYGKAMNALIQQDIRQFSVGLIVVHTCLFHDRLFRIALHTAGLPILKTGLTKINEISESIVFLTDKRETEKISSVVFDVSSQLELLVTLYDYETEEFKQTELIEHYEYLARIFSRNVNVITTDHENPIRAIQKKKNILHITPFSRNMLKSRIFWYASTDIEQLYFKLDRFPQLFIPVGAI